MTKQFYMEVEMSNKVFYIIGGLLLVGTIVVAAGLGFWAYKLNNELAQTQAAHQALQADYDELESSHQKAKESFKEQSNEAAVDLEDAQTQIERLERDLEAAQKESETLRGKITVIKAKVEVLDAFWFSSDASFQHKIDSMDDEQLQDLYEVFIEDETWESYLDLMTYMIESITEISGVSWEANLFKYTLAPVQVG
jgi:chromosome segregation ATPase